MHAIKFICHFQDQEKSNQDDLIKRLIEKVAELQNSLTYREVENIRLEGLFCCLQQKSNSLK